MTVVVMLFHLVGLIVRVIAIRRAAAVGGTAAVGGAAAIIRAVIIVCAARTGIVVMLFLLLRGVLLFVLGRVLVPLLVHVHRVPVVHFGGIVDHVHRDFELLFGLGRARCGAESQHAGEGGCAENERRLRLS